MLTLPGLISLHHPSSDTYRESEQSTAIPSEPPEISNQHASLGTLFRNANQDSGDQHSAGKHTQDTADDSSNSESSRKSNYQSSLEPKLPSSSSATEPPDRKLPLQRARQ